MIINTSPVHLQKIRPARPGQDFTPPTAEHCGLTGRLQAMVDSPFITPIPVISAALQMRLCERHLVTT